MALPKVGGCHPIHSGHEKDKKQRKEDSFKFCFKLGLESSALRLKCTPSEPLELRTLDLDWNYITDFPGSPVCGLQIVGLLSFHNYMSQCLIKNILYI